MNGNWRILVFAAAVAVGLAACGGGEPTTAAVQAPAPTAPNTAPVISGTPLTTVAAGAAYSFLPGATDTDGDRLTFAISGMPAWASFDTQTGQLSGIPTAIDVGTTASIVIRVTDGAATASLLPFQITVTASSSPPAATPPAGSNTAPTISGSPATSVASGASYTFAPSASDANGDTLTFSISNKPSWATFSTSTGRLSGTAAAGTYANIVISVSDGNTSVSLAPFTITVTQAGTGTAALSWTAPTQNTDGSTLTDLAGYKVYHGTSAGNLSDVIDVPGASSVSYMFNTLASGTHYFAVAAYNTSGMQSALSGVGSKTIQ